MDLLGNSKEAIAKRLMSQVTPSEMPIAQSVATAIVAVENQQAQAVEELRQAADLDVDHGHDPERRKEVLLGLADAVSEDRFQEWYLEELLDVDPVATKYAGLEADEWDQQKAEWYGEYAEADLVDDPIEDADQEAIDDVADRHLREVYDTGLEAFREAVVEWEAAEAAERVLAGPVLGHNQIIAESARRLEELEERVGELEGGEDGGR